MRRIARNRGLALRHVILTLIAVASGGCGATGSTDASNSQSLTGTWESSNALPGYVVTLSLAQSGSTVSGTGSTNENPPASISVTGTYQPPNVQLTLHVLAQGQSNANGATIAFSGTTTSATLMSGSMVVSQSGATSQGSATFTRQ